VNCGWRAPLSSFLSDRAGGHPLHFRPRRRSELTQKKNKYSGGRLAVMTLAAIALAACGPKPDTASVLPADAVYRSAYVDGTDRPLNGANRYVLHFDKGQEPPVRAFWSVTMYDPDSFFVANPLNHYALSSWMPFKRNADGSLDLYIQKDSPGKDKEANWLPAPASDFNLTMRLY